MPAIPPTQLTAVVSPVAAAPPTVANDSADSSDDRFPKFDRLGYDSIVGIYDDWFGDGDSAYCQFGGIKDLHNNKEWRNSLGDDAKKRGADKKMSQKMKRIGEHITQRRLQGETKEQVVQHLKEVMSKSPKSSETLTGIANVLQKLDSSASP